MILKDALIPSMFVIVGLVLLGIAMLAPSRIDLGAKASRQAQIVVPSPPASERIREIERLARGPNAVTILRTALDDPDSQVAAVAAILLRDCSVECKT
jgi:hypothetical protein